MLLKIKNDYRHIPFVYVNASSHQISLENSIPTLLKSIEKDEHDAFRTLFLSSTSAATTTSSIATSASASATFSNTGPFVPRVLLFKDLKQKRQKKANKDVSVGVAAYRDRFDSQPLTSFLQTLLIPSRTSDNAQDGMKPLKILPTLQQRKAPKPISKETPASKPKDSKTSEKPTGKDSKEKLKVDKSADKDREKPKPKKIQSDKTESEELRKMRLRREQMEKEDNRRKKREEENILNKVLKHSSSSKDGEGEVDLDEVEAEADPWLQWEDEQEEDLEWVILKLEQ